MKWAMVIGAGRGQVPLIKLLHKYAINVCVVSPLGDYPGFKYADDVLYADVKDLIAIEKYAKEKKIIGIVTDQLDASVYTCAYVAEKLNIKGITTSVADKFTDKYIMRTEAKKIGIMVPNFCRVNSIEELRTLNIEKYPLMLKPVDCAASKGVYKVYSQKELEQKFQYSKACSKKGEVIIEEYIQGQEFVVDAYTQNGIPTNLILGHREYFNIANTFIPKATIFTDANSANSHLEEKIKEINIALIKGFGLNFGITHAEYIYNADKNEVYLVEIAARGGGVFISSDIIPLACGVNATELLIRNILNLKNSKNILLKKGASGYFCYLTPKGKVSRLNYDGVYNVEGVKAAYFDNISLGMRTNNIEDKTSRKGPIIVAGKEKRDCYKIIEEVKEKVDIKIFNGKEEQDIIWD